MYIGNRPALAPLSSDQVKTAADLLYARIDKTNVPDRPFNNVLINSSFEHWQRGTGSTQATGAAAGYSADRWLIGGLGANGFIVNSRAALAFGDIPGSSSRFYAGLGCTGHTGPADGAYVQQRVEGVDTLAGKRVMLTGKIKQTGGSGARIWMDLQQNFGSGGSADVAVPPVLGAAAMITLTQTFQTFSIVFDVPSMSGKIIGSNDFLAVIIWLSAGSNNNARTNNLGLQTINVGLADVELKEVKPGYGDQAPGFERIPKELDFVRAMRFYQTGYLRGPVGGNTSGSYANNYIGSVSRLGVPMRVQPSATFNDSNGTANSINTGTRTTPLSSGGVGCPDNQHIYMDATLGQADNLYWWFCIYKLTAEL